MKNITKPVERFQSPLSTQACIYRKVSKPLMEKKRRARINECLEQLKSLLEEHYSNNIRKRKLEKADILELTVKHLRDLQGARKGVLMLTQEGVAEYQAGFRSCLNGVSQYLLRSKSTDEHLRLGVLNHLVNAFPVFSGSRFSTADSGCRVEAVPSPRAQAAHFQVVTPPPGELSPAFTRVNSPAKPTSPPHLARNSSQKRPVDEIRSDDKETDKISNSEPARVQQLPSLIPQSERPADNVLSPDSETLWRPW
ncbi:transcription factor HES-3-like [Rhincodon typus]|uniref:transcription factor HES-3-like n=1 Tax=Rhincodon typus TaxID=259920 RepID=UPI00202FFDFF|nr:transcription factor HES-3-like [Rhincodon typus]